LISVISSLEAITLPSWLFCGVTAFSSTGLTFTLMVVVGISVSLLRIDQVPDGEPRAVLAMGKRKLERIAASGGQSTAARRSHSIGFAQSLVAGHTADDLGEPWAAVFLSHLQNDRHADCLDLLRRIESGRDPARLKLEHSYDSQSTAFSGGCRYSPTTSVTSATSSGPVENLKRLHPPRAHPVMPPGP
jgi:hypothetical protein